MRRKQARKKSPFRWLTALVKSTAWIEQVEGWHIHFLKVSRNFLPEKYSGVLH